MKEENYDFLILLLIFPQKIKKYINAAVHDYHDTFASHGLLFILARHTAMDEATHFWK